MVLEVPLCGCEIVNLKGQMRYVPICKGILRISTRMRLDDTSLFGLNEQMNFSTASPQPAIAARGNFFHAEHVAIKLARPIDILHEHGCMIESKDIHSGVSSFKWCYS
jgi:hypothetical protein